LGDDIQEASPPAKSPDEGFGKVMPDIPGDESPIAIFI
jgi:hypothetical protein